MWPRYYTAFALLISCSVAKAQQAEDTASARAPYTLAQKYLAKGDRASALYFLNKAIGINPYNASYFLERSALYLEMGQTDSCFADLRRAHHAAPKNARILYLQSQTHMAIQQPDSALADIAGAEALEPRNRSVRRQKAYILSKLQRYDEALKEFDWLIASDPKNPAYYYNKGSVYEAQKKFQEAIAFYSKAISLGDDEAYNNRAICREETKDYAGAEKDYNEAVSRRASDPTVYANRGRFLMEQNKLDQAKLDLKTWNSMTPDDANSWYQLAVLYKKQNDPEACIYAKKAKELGCTQAFELSEYCK
jgi:tetratricopeptide (TPR) repeat protein